jgi:hypothetical protein
MYTIALPRVGPVGPIHAMCVPLKRRVTDAPACRDASARSPRYAEWRACDHEPR